MTAPKGISLEKAIKRLKKLREERLGLLPYIDAIQLGIAALKRIDNVRNVGSELPGAPLPGERRE